MLFRSGKYYTFKHAKNFYPGMDSVVRLFVYGLRLVENDSQSHKLKSTPVKSA